VDHNSIPLLALPAPESAPAAQRVLLVRLRLLPSTPRSFRRLLARLSSSAFTGAIPDDARRDAIAAAEAHLNQPWPSLPATLFLEYRRAGNRSAMKR
jgi:hypothetical protein